MSEAKEFFTGALIGAGTSTSRTVQTGKNNYVVRSTATLMK